MKRQRLHFIRSMVFCLSLFIFYGLVLHKAMAAESSPDSFGYRWTDNKYPEPTIPFNWIDIVSTGNFVQFWGDDSTTVNIGFDFNFYGNPYSTVTIGDNGYLTFGSTGTAYNNVSIPNSGSPNNIVAPFWDDLGFSGVQVYYETRGTAP